MEAIILREKNSLTQQIKLTLLSIERDTATIVRLKSQDNYSVKQIEKLHLNIDRNTELVNTLEDRMDKLESGALNEELMAKVKTATATIKKAVVTKTMKKAELDADIKKKFNIMKEFEGSHRADDRTARYMKKEMDRSYKYYCRIVNELPPNMARNIKNMANNKGYIWRGVYFYGNKHIDGPDTVMFERKGNAQHIHTWNNFEYKLSEKQGNNPKKRPTLLKRIPRRIIAGAPELVDTPPVVKYNRNRQYK